MNSFIGEIIGSYKVEAEIGRGGMGIVLKAVHEALQRPVALKLLAPHIHRDNPSARDRFLREAKTAARLNHPNIVQVYDAGTTGEVHYVAMEFVDGKNLSEILKEGKALPPSEVIRIILACAEGLRAASVLGIVHRDIKPSNIMVTQEGLVKVADFGLAKTLHIPEDQLTLAGAVMGTPMYMSPEQVMGESLDSRSDIYSLALVMLESLTRRMPFEKMPGLQLLSRRLRNPHLQPKALSSALLTKPVKTFLHGALSPSIDKRFQNFDEFISELKSLDVGLKPSQSADSDIVSLPDARTQVTRGITDAGSLNSIQKGGSGEEAGAGWSSVIGDVVAFGAACLEILSQSWVGNLSEGKNGESIVDIVRKRLHQLEEKRSDLLRVVLFGEFKSGKSSLINALYGRKMSAVDILEMTSWISRIIPTEGTDRCTVRFRDGTSLSLPPDEFLEKTERREFTGEFLERIDHVEMLIQASPIPCMMMDTPGMGSMTRENEKRMLEAIADGDLLVWVLDCTALGNLGETTIAKAARTNEIPILCALTKCDELESPEEQDGLIKWVTKESDIDRSLVFPTQNLGEGWLPGSEGKDTGVQRLVVYLQEEAAPRQQKVRKKAFLGQSRSFISEVARLLADSLAQWAFPVRRALTTSASRAGAVNMYPGSMCRAESKSYSRATMGAHCAVPMPSSE